MMKTLKYIATLLFWVIICSAEAQISKTNTEININYVPLGSSDITFSSVEFKKRIKTFKLSEDNTSFLRFGLAFSGADIEHEESNEINKHLEDFFRVGLTFDYIKTLNKKWGVLGVLRPRLSSNFSTGVTSDDFNIFGLLALNFQNSENSKFTFGVMYANTFGSSLPLPYINYWKRFNEKWEMNIGFPRTGLTTTLSDRVKIHSFLELQGYSSNISKNIKNDKFIDNRTAERMNYKDSSVGLEYEYRFNKWILKTKAGYTLKREFTLESGDDEIAYEFSVDKNLFVGLSFGLNL